MTTRKDIEKSQDSLDSDLLFDADIFQYLKPNDNCILSEMSGLDLLDLITQINHYYLQLRDQLKFTDKTTFGIEIEFENANVNKIKNRLEDLFPKREWCVKKDNSLRSGAEINSPILMDNIDTWKDLSTVCSMVNSHASIGKNSGGHVHIGSQILGNKIDSWVNFLKIWSVYENIIFRFLYGEFLTARDSLEKFAYPVSKIFWRDYSFLQRNRSSYVNHIDDMISLICHGNRYVAVNFYNVDRDSCECFEAGNTIEFRCPNGTLNPPIWQNYINFLVHLLYYSNSTAFNDDIVSKRREKNLDMYSDLNWYDEIYLEQALELCDMIFSTNLDKVYFMRQYLKSLQVVNPRNKTFTKAKPFTQ